MADDIRTRLSEALDEAEKLARAAITDAGCGCHGTSYGRFSAGDWLFDGEQAVLWGDGLHEVFAGAAYGGTYLDKGIGEHAARWDPSTVLRLVGSHRELIAALDLAQADMDAKVRTFDNYGTGELIAATARCKALREEVDRVAAFWLGTQEES